ncbi:MAG: YcxB family protein [Saprospiraceae bacterium]|nr:YcxB family protein [Candidatus Opimibacter skivensis]
MYFQARKTFLSDKKFSQPIQWDFDIEGAASKGFGFAISFTWNSILNVTESKDAFLIYHSNRTANIIPKRDLAPLEISHFQQLIKSIPGLKSELWLRQKGASEVAFIPATRIQRFLNFVLDLIFFLYSSAYSYLVD